MDLLADFDHIRKGLPIVNWVEQQESLNFIRQRIKWQKDHFLHVHCECTNRAYSKTDQCRQCPEFQSSQDFHWPWFPCDRSLKWIEMNKMLHFVIFIYLQQWDRVEWWTRPGRTLSPGPTCRRRQRQSWLLWNRVTFSSFLCISRTRSEFDFLRWLNLLNHSNECLFYACVCVRVCIVGVFRSESGEEMRLNEWVEKK